MEPHESETALSIVANGDALPTVAQPASVLSGTELALYVSARLTTEEEKLFAMQAISGECPEARNLDGKEFECRFVVGCFTKEIEDESGEVYMGRKFVFVGPDGSMVKASGKTIPQTVALAASTFGLGPWEPPVRFRVRCKANPPPKSPTVFLDCLGRAKPAQAKKGGGK